MAVASRGTEVASITYTFLILSTIATLLRIYCRGWVIKAFSYDDWLAVAAQFLFIIFCAYEITGVTYGTGKHFADIEDGHVPKAMQMWWTCEPLYVLCNMAIKASIAIFLLRICVTRVHKIIIWTVIGVTELYSFFFFLLFVLQCRPTSLFWLRYSTNPPEGNCLDASVVANAFYGYSAISCVTDWTYSILPIFLVWSLQMNTRVKVSVVLILAAGAIASSATIVRFPYLYSLTDINDFLYSTADVAIWSTIETGLGITAAGVATLRPLLKTFFGGGSSAPGHGTSARQWQRTGSGHPKGETGFDLHDRSNKGLGVTTVIDYGNNHGVDIESQKVKGDNRSDTSNPFAGGDDWNSSQTNLAESPDNGGQGWNITVKKSIVQTSGNA
ncbi:hypothetical protein JX265_007215 [Neoarthrinium moseri]|uniref:Rhodopsin domain-containing protein n=1 Tax=Neoarthrinium moseri TaxID=1658444 RepID=A0A9Q0AP06_9PEZI|nr:uncharacterized protein JN550_013252 [Neoarthrinium moseri]KAI1840394.1 hypothetical protein JX266_013402 [Neoarthrinium moseri]KAI1857372.1 hypothetical protein JN550_013252 [Neoarthrinium moseri]KAI1868392.1 hypothetical protein JX265_007215 [Neoarthrinium moseri]